MDLSYYSITSDTRKWTLQLLSLDGQINVLAGLSGYRESPTYIMYYPKFVGDFAVWPDPANNELIIYDPDKQTAKRFNPGY